MSQKIPGEEKIKMVQDCLRSKIGLSLTLLYEQKLPICANLLIDAFPSDRREEISLRKVAKGRGSLWNRIKLDFSLGVYNAKT